jgi:hypothetical protein
MSTEPVAANGRTAAEFLAEAKQRAAHPGAYHRGNYVGGHSGLGASTRKIVVAELRHLTQAIEAGCDPVELLRARADQIEDAGWPRWDCGARLGGPHVPGCACPAAQHA